MALTKTKKDFTSGSLFLPMLTFVLPIMLTGILQVIYNMADNMVVGQFSGDPNALAAVGSTSSLTNLVVNVLMGLGAGSGIVVSHAFGAKNYGLLEKAVHTAMTFSLVGGIAFSALGFFISEPALIMMGTRPELVEGAVLYMRIICLGIPASAVFNFGATILRSVGDSKTPLYILASTGIINVALNLVFVIVFHMSIAGVALSTILSQYLSAIILVYILNRRKNEAYGLCFSKLGIDGGVLLRILRFGIPAGIQSGVFSISNVIITTAINTFPTTTISAKTIAGNIEGLLYTALNSYMHASMTFVGQNYGAKKPERIKKSILYAVTQVLIIGTLIGQLMILFGEPLSLMYIDANDPNKEEVLATTLELLRLMLSSYVLCGLMEALAGSLRGLGFSLLPMMVNLIGTCGMRILWIAVFFPMPIFNNIIGVFLIYPISWTLTILAHLTVLLIFRKKIGGLRSHPQPVDNSAS